MINERSAVRVGSSNLTQECKIEALSLSRAHYQRDAPARPLSNFFLYKVTGFIIYFRVTCSFFPWKKKKDVSEYYAEVRGTRRESTLPDHHLKEWASFLFFLALVTTKRSGIKKNVNLVTAGMMPSCGVGEASSWQLQLRATECKDVLLRAVVSHVKTHH